MQGRGANNRRRVAAQVHRHLPMTRPDGQSDAAEEVTLDFDYDEEVPGFETSASNCLNRALQIARSLNHMSLSADHLMLALAMDPSARRLLERVGDIVQLREAATQRLGRMHSRFTTGDSFPSKTSDLVDIRKGSAGSCLGARPTGRDQRFDQRLSPGERPADLRLGRRLKGGGFDGADRAGSCPPRSRGHDKNRSGGAGGHAPLTVRPVPSARSQL